MPLGESGHIPVPPSRSRWFGRWKGPSSGGPSSYSRSGGTPLHSAIWSRWRSIEETSPLRCVNHHCLWLFCGAWNGLKTCRHSYMWAFTFNTSPLHTRAYKIGRIPDRIRLHEFIKQCSKCFWVRIRGGRYIYTVFMMWAELLQEGAVLIKRTAGASQHNQVCKNNLPIEFDFFVEHTSSILNPQSSV